MADKDGISLTTDKKITVVAKGIVSISGKTAVTAALMGEVMMAKGNILTGEVKTTQVQSNQYDLLATDYTCIEGRNQQIFEAYDDAPQEGSCDWGGLIGNVLAGLAVVGAVALTRVTFGAATPVVVGAIAVGSIFVVYKGINDYKSGEISSTISYMTTGLVWSVVGAVTVSGILWILYARPILKSVIDAIKDLSWAIPPPSFGSALELIDGEVVATGVAEGITITGQQILTGIGQILGGALTAGGLLFFSKNFIGSNYERMGHQHGNAPRNNQPQNKQAKDARRAAEKSLGRKLTEDEW